MPNKDKKLVMYLLPCFEIILTLATEFSAQNLLCFIFISAEVNFSRFFLTETVTGFTGDSIIHIPKCICANASSETKYYLIYPGARFKRSLQGTRVEARLLL